MLALPDGQKVYAEDVEAILKEDSRVKDAAIVGWPLGGGLKVHAVLLLGDAGDEDRRPGRQRQAGAASADPRLRLAGR